MTIDEEVIAFITSLKPFVRGHIKYTKLATNPNHFYLQYGDNYEKTLHLIFSCGAQRWEVLVDLKAHVFGKCSKVLVVRELSELIDAILRRML
jgi:hypothetical protein